VAEDEAAEASNGDAPSDAAAAPVDAATAGN
jgi:hypothetical protein